ncbi:dienelactone hydrolase family protein [Streptomyces parvulus]|uniref:Dienelactone hydrolase family protein n=2 Tax=Streptomyces parvulus TaxID=146923 RepID=A0A191V7G9_9ACTN|nr:dienelactone hydrolase family protein [Streptomyces parvulus]MZD57487.1 alpha/beta hydrolase [Streptomyces sp. SID5606]ANJ10870.1 lipase [Streptomyces parvulus]MCC9156313.1 dienelactone hydrolase family protein [Streptomyces parvulus]MCE7691760.1 dienelactone hydrolase family protein [Streptomyces parvulus]GGR68171.1 lipase [Streptomyces parvulus]
MQQNPHPHAAPVLRRTRRRLAGLTTAVAAVLALGTLTGPGAQAADNPYERGPAPTQSSIEALRGPYSVADTSVSSLSVTGFGGGTVYYPTSTSDGTFGAVVISPGFTAYQSSISWLGARLASQGFVVFTIDTNTTLDQPDSRGRQLLAALDYLTERSSVRGRIDSSRLGVMGHSMGGGGSLEAAKSRPSLQAAIPLTPWNLDKSWPEVSTPTLIFGADGDTVAPVASHAEPFYSGLPSGTDRAYLELNNATHFSPNSSNTTIAKYSISWLKRFIDNDTRYEQFLCPLPRPSLTIEEYRGNCPHGS